jgi:hypothetical protein
VVRITATTGIHVNPSVDPSLTPAPLVVHVRYASAGSPVAESPLGLTPEGFGDVLETAGEHHAQLRLDDTMIRIEAPAGEAVPEGATAGTARFAYWIDPEWTGPEGLEKRVVIVAAPGVVVRTGEPATSPLIDYGRRLVETVVRVPHPDLVPAQGTRIRAEDFVGHELVSPDAGRSLLGRPDEGVKPEQLTVATGLAGVTVAHPWSGARLSIRPRNREVGAAYAWQVLPPEGGHPGEIRAVVEPDVEVEFFEPVPLNLRSEVGSTPTPRPEQARAGEGLSEQGIVLNLVEVWDAAKVPRQGTRLNIQHYLAFGRYRDADRHHWLDTNDLPFELAMTAADVGVGMIPIVGDLVDIGEFFYALGTGRDRWGREVGTGDKVLMGIGALVGLIRGLGGIGSVLRRAPAMLMGIADLARRLGKSPEQLEVVLVRVQGSVVGDEAALVRRAVRAAETGEAIDPEDLPRLQQVMSRVAGESLVLEPGRGLLGLRAGAQSDLFADPAAADPMRSSELLTLLTRAQRASGDVPDELLVPLVRSGGFSSADEAQAAVEQAVRDAARRGAVDADDELARAIAEHAGEVAGDVLQVTPQTRRLAVSQPELLAQYERLVNDRLPAVIDDVLRRQGSTPRRRRLAELRTRFDELLALGEEVQLTPQPAPRRAAQPRASRASLRQPVAVQAPRQPAPDRRGAEPAVPRVAPPAREHLADRGGGALHRRARPPGPGGRLPPRR